MPVVDTSVLVPFFNSEHPAHHRSRDAIGAAGSLYVSRGVISEMTTTLRRLAKAQGLDGEGVAREALGQLEGLAGFTVADQAAAADVSALFRASNGMSYVDAWGIVLALQLGDDLLTFDEQQRAIWRREKRRR